MLASSLITGKMKQAQDLLIRNKIARIAMDFRFIFMRFASIARLLRWGGSKLGPGTAEKVYLNLK